MKMIKDLKKGDYFTLKEIYYPKESQVYVRGEYNGGGDYIIYKFNDINNFRSVSGYKKVYDDTYFIF